MLSGVATAWMLVKLLTGVFDPPPDALSIPWVYLGIVLLLMMAAVVAAVLAARPPHGHDAEYLRDF
jgi:putative ABC transport system permease protein